MRGYDLVAGYRKGRNDKMLTRKVPSFVANRIIDLSFAAAREIGLPAVVKPRVGAGGRGLLRHPRAAGRRGSGRGCCAVSPRIHAAASSTASKILM